MPTFRKSVAARRDEVVATLEELGAFLDGCGLSARARNAVDVAAEELLSNVLKFAYPEGEPGPATLVVDVGAVRARLEVVDSGSPFDPTRVPPPPAPTLDSEPGGRGIHLVRSLSSSFTYRREGSRNVVTVELRAS